MIQQISISKVTTVPITVLYAFVAEVDLFMRENLLELYTECDAKKIFKNLLRSIKIIKSKRLFFHLYAASFAKNIRNRTKLRASLVSNRGKERIYRISIKNWDEIKKTIADHSKEELILIAEKLLDEVFIHLGEIAVETEDLRIQEILNAHSRKS